METKIISEQPYLDVQVIEDGAGQPTLHAVEGTGYQFVQNRGLVILDTPVDVWWRASR